ncbi:histidine kinase [Aquimarina addita]|uniref:Histidine kinase n=2 Tax=Aquimarina addita TaxID=870485 RepID=A0ABP6UR25_9FLAO
MSNGFNFEKITTVTWWGINFMYSFSLTYINTLYFRLINYKFEWKNKGLKRVFVGAGGSIFITIVGFAICNFITQVVILEQQTVTEFLSDQSVKNYLFPLLFTTIISLFFHAMYFYKALQENKVTEQKIIAGTASAKFAALKNQLDPHFLFNSLNVLTSLIEENPKMAQKFTTSLSKVYRYVLEQKAKELITVDEELRFAKTYMTLLKLRFEDSIIFDIPEHSTNPEAKVVPLSLQILLENSVKHNIVMPNQPLHIKIYEDNGFLMVENNLQPKKIVKQSSGVGLGNVKQRYELLTKKEFSVYKTDTAFIAKLPILTKKVTAINMNASATIEITKDLKYKRAKERVKKIKEFYINLITFCIVIPFLIFINYRTSFDFPWVLFPIGGWGIGLLFNYIEAFDHHPIFGKDWEKRKIKKYMEASKRKNYE